MCTSQFVLRRCSVNVNKSTASKVVNFGVEKSRPPRKTPKKWSIMCFASIQKMD
jgi:hypothetical protein